MMNTSEVNDLFKQYAEKIAEAWRISDDEDAGWLEAEVRIKLGGSEKPQEVSFTHKVSYPSAKDKKDDTGGDSAL